MSMWSNISKKRRLSILKVTLVWALLFTPVNAHFRSTQIPNSPGIYNQSNLQASPDSRVRQIRIKLFGRTLNLTLDVSTLGLIITLTLVALLFTTTVMAAFARRRARQAQTANRKLLEQIAERERVQESLIETQHRTAAIVESAIDAIVTMDHEGKILAFNPAAEQIFGHRRDDVIGKPLADVIIPPSSREHHRRGLNHYLATGEGPVLGKRLEMTGLKADGSSVLLELSIVRMPGGEAPMFTGFMRDITERKRAEEKAHSQLIRLNLLHQITRAIAERLDLRSIFQVVLEYLENNLPLDFACVGLYDPEIDVLTITQIGSKSSALELMPAQQPIHLKEDGFIKFVRGELVYEPDISQVSFPLISDLSKGGLRSIVLAPLMIERRVFGVLFAARRQINGFNSSDCEFLRQLSEHVGLAAHQAQLYQALQQSYEDLRQTQQAVMDHERLRSLGQMASGIAHDINNAISPVALYTESLLENETNLSAKGRHALETIQRAIDDVAETVSRMREFSRRPEQDKPVQHVNLNTLARQVLDLTRAKWSGMPQQQGITIHPQLELDPTLPEITGIESEIREALTNLVFNAVDAMPDGGKLIIRTRTSGNDQSSSKDRPAAEHVQIEVADTGIGMEENTKRRALEPFFTTKGERGTGLGLAMVYGIAERHGAEIQIDSAPNQGTTVRLIFTIAAIDSSVGAEAQTRKPSVPSKRILIVDDDPLVLESLFDALTNDGHVVVSAQGGQQGIESFLDSLKDVAFDVVITDLGMPYVDGRQVAREIKLASPSTPVILLTGWGQRLVSDDEVPVHVDAVINKPPKLVALRETLAAVLP